MDQVLVASTVSCGTAAVHFQVVFQVEPARERGVGEEEEEIRKEVSIATKKTG